MEWLFETSIIVISVVLTVVLTLVLQEPIQAFMARRLTIVPRLGPNLTGRWDAVYRYKTDGQSLIEQQSIELRHFGTQIWGRTIESSDHEHFQRARLEGQRYVTGTWHSRKRDNTYHGAFQLIVDPSGHSMRGKWLGFSRSGTINDGPWEWHRRETSRGGGASVPDP